MQNEQASGGRAVVPAGYPGGAAVPAPPPHPLDGQWYMSAAGTSYGPFTGHQMRDFAMDGRLLPDTDVIRVGAQTWIKAVADSALAALFAPVPALAGQPAAAAAGPVSAAPGATIVQVTNNLAPQPARAVVIDGDAGPKSAGVALLLSLLICGAGQLYNGQVGKGILMFVGCVVLWFILLGWIVMIWSWIDAYSTAKRKNERYLRLLASGAIA